MRRSQKPLRAAVILALALLGIMASGCGAAEAPGQPAPRTSELARESSTWAQDKSWAADLSRSDGRLYVTTLGSSSCPTVAQGLDTTDPGRFVVTLAKPEESGPCTADLAPHTSSVPVPEDAVGEGPVVLALEGNPMQITLQP